MVRFKPCLLLSLALSVAAPIQAFAKNVKIPVGVNVNSFQNFDEAKQNAIVEQLKSAKVDYVRTSLRMDQKNLTLAKNMQDRGIGLVLVAGLKFAEGTKQRPANEQYRMRAAMPLSALDLELTKASFQDIFDQLDQAGVTLTAVELGNELNWSDFNGDFPVPGQGKSFSRQDLNKDPEAKKVAYGFIQHVKALRALKVVRDASKLNAQTPIISCGMAGVTGGAWQAKAKVDGVSIPATYAFLREHGIDDIVDGYGTHAYPGQVKAGDKKAFDEREQKLDKQMFPEGNSKPYWVTEWGFVSKEGTDDTEERRLRSVIEMRTYLHKIQKQGRLGGIFWYVWNEPDNCSVYRNGHLTEAGMRATRPM